MTTAPTETQDLQDMERLAAGHDVCLDHLIARHGLRLFRYLARVLSDEREAEDAAQETFVKIYQHRARFNPHGHFAGWLFSIATNLARDRLRRRHRRAELPLDVADAETDEVQRLDLYDPRLNPAESLAAREAGDLVRAAVQSLPEDLRIPLILAEYDALSHAEIGQVLGCTAKAVEMRLYRARQALRGILKPLLTEEGRGRVPGTP